MRSQLKQQIKSIAQDSGVILLYHSVAESMPDALQGTLHNVAPRIFETHLQQLSTYFEFVSLEEFARAAKKKGLIAITFDDGYKNVFENALPILESFDYPFTFFLNSLTFEKRWNWRDKVRYLIHHELVDEFEQGYEFDFKEGRFYRYSKNPKNNSADLDLALNTFLGDREIDIYQNYPYLQQTDLLDHRLVTYGNHSQNHYVLASLTDEQQEYEISAAQNALNSVTDLSLSQSFSAPFGGENDINDSTTQILKQFGYKDLLMSRQQLQSDRSKRQNIQILERFMPRSDDIVSELAA